jgi:hypothetical protein
LRKGGIAEIFEDDGVGAPTMQSLEIAAEGNSSVREISGVVRGAR